MADETGFDPHAFELNLGGFGFPTVSSGLAEEQKEKRAKVRTRGTVTHDRQFFRRFKSERDLEEHLPWDFEEGCAYHVISGGDIDSLTFLKHVIRQQPLDYCIMSTWCMALQDIEELDRWMRLGRIRRLDSYVGEIFKGTYSNEWKQLCALHGNHGGRVAIFRNHSKIYVCFGQKFDCVIESSANVNTNPRTENTVVTVSAMLAKEYKAFFDGINSFERNFDDWKPCEIDRITAAATGG
jgi:hypothetical protein